MEQLDQLLENYLHELQSMPENEVLEGEFPSEVKKRAMTRLERAVVDAGRRRLAAAKAGLGKVSGKPHVRGAADVSAVDARAYIRRAANNPLYTLAARKLDEMSDVEVLHLYQLILELEAENSKHDHDSGSTS